MADESQDEKKERRYESSQDDVRMIRRELDKSLQVWSEAISTNKDILKALKGDGLGNEGLLNRVGTLEEEILGKGGIKETMDDIIIKINKRMDRMNIIMLMAGSFLGIFLKWLFEQITLHLK